MATAGASPQKSADDEIKKAVQGVQSPSGTDKDGKPDGSLSSKQVSRAATEAMIAMRPQPSVNEMNYVFHRLLDGKYKTVDEVISATKGFVDEGRKAA